MAEGMDPERMTKRQRLDEIAQLLAVGLVRAMKKSEKYCKKSEIFEHNCLAVLSQKGPDLAGH